MLLTQIKWKLLKKKLFFLKKENKKIVPEKINIMSFTIVGAARKYLVIYGLKISKDNKKNCSFFVALISFNILANKMKLIIKKKVDKILKI